MDETSIENAPILLRPHHLLCTQDYEGRGYSEAFVRNMSSAVQRIRTNPDLKVRITFAADSLCAFCPNLADSGACRDQEKVLAFDQGVAHALGLQEKGYKCQDLMHRFHEKMNADPELLRRICGSCSWYENSACEENIREGKYLL